MIEVTVRLFTEKSLHWLAFRQIDLQTDKLDGWQEKINKFTKNKFTQGTHKTALGCKWLVPFPVLSVYSTLNTAKVGFYVECNVEIQLYAQQDFSDTFTDIIDNDIEEHHEHLL